MRTPIDKITPHGIVTVDGAAYDADVIVYATGFRHTDVLWPLKVTGRNGSTCTKCGELAVCLLGHHRAGISELLHHLRPGNPLAHGGSLIFQSELQMRYIDQCLARLCEPGVHSIEPKPDAAIDWHRRTQAQIKKMVWSHPAVKHSYFKNADGEIHTVSPWRLSSTGPRCASDWSQFVVRTNDAVPQGNRQGQQ